MRKRNGVSVWGVLFVIQMVFVVEKVVGVMPYDWVYVLIPLWMMVGLFALILITATAYWIFIHRKED